ncbi:UNVERIFIED_CONTAM: hypothetical protein FKN15_043562 [Acipenser sinensis]
MFLDHAVGYSSEGLQRFVLLSTYPRGLQARVRPQIILDERPGFLLEAGHGPADRTHFRLNATILVSVPAPLP